MGDSSNVLLVGAGAVGQVFGRHLQLGGARVHFFVRDKYRDLTARGFDMYPLDRRRGRQAPIRFEGFGVVTTIEEVARERFDQVYLTVPSPGLRGAWLPELVAAIGEATLVSLQPSPEDRALLLASGVAPERLVSGMVSLVSYAAPLAGETRFPRPGMAYWFPPLAPSPFSGSSERTLAVVQALRRGKLPAKRHRDVPRAIAFPTAILMAYLTALEAAGWSLRALRRDGLVLAAHAAREAIAIAAQTAGRPPLAARLAAWPALTRMGLWIGERVTPFPLEAYLKSHFTKVGEQTRMIMSSMIAAGARSTSSVAALEKLTELAAAGPAAGIAAGPAAGIKEP